MHGVTVFPEARGLQFHCGSRGLPHLSIVPRLTFHLKAVKNTVCVRFAVGYSNLSCGNLRVGSIF